MGLDAGSGVSPSQRTSTRRTPAWPSVLRSGSDAWKAATAKIYDGSPMYRLAYGLRSFTHVDMPGSLRSRTHVTEPTELVLELKRDHLLERGDWQAITKQDLRDGPETFSGLEIIEQAQSDLRALVIHELVCDFSAAAGAYNRVSALVNEVDESTDEECDPIVVDQRDGTAAKPMSYRYLSRADLDAVYRAAHGDCRLRAMEQEIVLDVPVLTELRGT